jgi:hypothetical protein
MSFCSVPPSCACHHRQGGAVHRHGDGHFVEGDAVEQELHVLDAVDSHAGLANVADDAFMIGVVTAVRCEIERDRQAGLAGCEITPVERVRFFGG